MNYLLVRLLIAAVSVTITIAIISAMAFSVTKVNEINDRKCREAYGLNYYYDRGLTHACVNILDGQLRKVQEQGYKAQNAS